jgi:hypothetical protein
MATVREALENAERELFVGRERELELFECWLSADPLPPQVLEVSGPGGIGKSTLLAAFRRVAQAHDRPVVDVDLRGAPKSTAAFLSLLGGTDVQSVAEHLNAFHPLVLLDTFEDADPHLQHLLAEELLPRLDTAVKVVIAGRFRLSHVWRTERPTRVAVRSISLNGICAQASRAYLARRGLKDPCLIQQILTVVGGHPLALSMAADLTLTTQGRNFSLSPERHLLIRSLAEQMLRNVADPHLQELILASAIVEQFDQSTLEAMIGKPASAAAFEQLCRLSVVRPGPHGLMLHDEVRRIVADDLRWRHNDQYSAFRLRALDYFRERMRSAAKLDREWLLAQCLYLWEHAFVQTMLFGQDDPGEVWIESGTVDDECEALEIETIWQSHIVPALGMAQCELDLERDADCHRQDVARLLGLPGRRLRIARGQDGEALGFSLVAFVNAATSECLIEHRIFGPLLQAYFDRFGWHTLPMRGDDTRIAYFLQVRHKGIKPEAVTAALMRDLFGVLVREPVALTTVVLPERKQLMHAMGFERLPVEYPAIWGGESRTEAYMLDLRHIGVEHWMEAIMAGRKPPVVLATNELERAVQDALAHWHEDAWLAESMLAQSAAVAAASPHEQGAEAVRQSVLQALGRTSECAPPEVALACRAVKSAYLVRSASHERVARDLSVSRTTFYRLLRRGVHAIALTLTTA